MIDSTNYTIQDPVPLVEDRTMAMVLRWCGTVLDSTIQDPGPLVEDRCGRHMVDSTVRCGTVVDRRQYDPGPLVEDRCV